MDEKRFVNLLWVLKASLLVVLVCAGLGAVTGRLHLGTALEPSTASGEQRAPGKQVAQPETRSRSDYTQIVQSSLFGEAQAAPEPGSSRSQALDSLASAESLGLKLVGAIAGGPAASRAIIQNNKGNTAGAYRIGDTVASATVVSIQRDAAILRLEGQDLVLRLQTGTTGENNGSSSKDTQRNTEQTAGAKSADVQTIPPAARAGYVTEIFRKATIEPYVKNRRVEGLRITGLEKIPMAEMLGLKNGDIVQAVNGQQLNSKQKAFQVLMKAKTQSKVSIQLLRDGKSKDLSFDL